jgi:peptide/nickel transport system permease protein
LGQTKLGYDVLARLIYGARTSLTVALPAIAMNVIGGVIIGTAAAYYRGWVDSIIMRICDIFLAFPGLILALVFIAIFGRQIEYVIFVWGLLGIPYYSRLIRGNVLQARELPYIQAARVAGAGNGRIMFKHILPNVVQPVIISLTFDIGTMVLSLAALSFLGFSDPDMIEWGNDISNARTNLYDAPWASLYPGFMILICVLGFMLVGDGLRDALDPRLRNL